MDAKEKATESYEDFDITLNKLKSHLEEHVELADIHRWITHLYAKGLVDESTKVCRVSSFRIAKYQIFAISDVNDLVTPVSVTAALRITVPADQQLLPEETVHLCTVLQEKTSSSSSPKETIIVSSSLLSHTLAIPFDAKHPHHRCIAVYQ
jgi:hypothetical protein